MNYLEKFNETFILFIKDLVQAFPSDAEFKLYQIALQGITYTDPDLVREMFHEHVTVKFEKEIMNKDEQFFLQQDYSSYQQKYAKASSIIQKLKTSWGLLDEENRSIVWKYLKVLLALDKKIEAQSI